MRRWGILATLGVLTLAAVVAAMAVWPRPGPATAAGAVTALSAGGYHTCALTSAGGVKCWGGNVLGELGDGTTDQRNAPVNIYSSDVAAVSAGGYHTCAITTAGGVTCWGYSGSGELGNGTSTGPQMCFGSNPCSTAPVDVSGMSSGNGAIAAGGIHTCALTTMGSVKCWGGNGLGQLGIGTSSGPQTCTVTGRVYSCSTTPVDVSGLAGVVAAIAAGGAHTCALTSAGGVKCWGYNAYGQLGDGTTTNRSSPVDVSGLTSGVAAVSAGEFHTCAVTIAGGVRCWGYNAQGQLGDGTTTDRSAPVDVSGLGGGVVAVSAGLHHTCALTSARALKCWGEDHYGQLGDGATMNRSTPVDVSGLAGGVAAVSAGGGHTCALTTAGPVKCWGNNGFAQLGDGTTTDSSTPVNLLGVGLDSDGDGCPDKNELQTAIGSEVHGGRRDPLNPWDYFNPTHDGKNRVDDILVVVQHFGLNQGDPGYDTQYDRTALGPNPWNLGPPDGKIRVTDILAIVAQFNHDCP